MEAWKMYKQSNGKMNLTTIVPSVVLGKYITPNFTVSAEMLKIPFVLPYILNKTLATVSIETITEAHI